ncbi:hypothetical protein TVAG_053470 [Trichomonas vaginalis G3]|uniref:Nucleoside 2-deoxyribosyltransferase n=1 Tax=Trichomonas vaginalis (strain ATCC PRA-98 / G3) TaxID=412133 RepID=A2EMV0_TRIV3|nr:nucleoside 2-deoxyribosyltransferase family [Trichomonas vaginalis G3]EAY06023.1 hypothetical protein TVAG_053470 [Trichomonas vaginalis G3]KAI5512814.1 nucleoside 2-deoxyribosyltransferase family [Trichomonas vaginalis G3]|eukprot:XP_001318246.1 hypothetical protein [Trichomonas vaginalis G3]
MDKSYLIYFAGDLFDQKHITGNALLGQMIEKVSKGKYKCHLPQNKETIKDRGTPIRDKDIENLMKCDCAIFNFDGTDLDSGTVVEFCYAKMVDIPSIQLRTDFRQCGDQNDGGDPWNLMCSGYPRTKSLLLNALGIWQESRAKYPNLSEQLEYYHKSIAIKIIEQLDDVIAIKPLFNGSVDQANSAYNWAVKTVGGKLNEYLTESCISELIQSKHAKGLI